MTVFSQNSLQTLCQRAKRVIPGAVNSPVRNMKSVDQDNPFFVEKAWGPHILGKDGHTYTDWCQTWGSMILGHSHPIVISAVQKALCKGSHFGFSTEVEVLMAEALVHCVPSLEQVRCVSSGTEATMSAVRLARAHTKRNAIVKFEGCYHGHADFFLSSAGSGVSQIAKASSAGVPPKVVEDVFCLPYNDSEAIETLFKKEAHRISAVILEPVCANMGVVLPQNDFLKTLRTLTHHHGSLLIFDEVITGFRVARGGVQDKFAVIPDLSCLGKIIGGGFNVGAFGGRQDIMKHLAPCGDVYQAGTLSGNPIAMTAGLSTLQILQKDDFYKHFNDFAEKSLHRLKKSLSDTKSPIKVQSIGSLFSFFFGEKDQISSFEDIRNCDHKLFAKLHKHALHCGHFFSPSGYETNFIGQAHTSDHIDSLIETLLSFTP